MALKLLTMLEDELQIPLIAAYITLVILEVVILIEMAIEHMLSTHYIWETQEALLQLVTMDEATQINTPLKMVCTLFIGISIVLVMLLESPRVLVEITIIVQVQDIMLTSDLSLLFLLVCIPTGLTGGTRKLYIMFIIIAKLMIDQKCHLKTGIIIKTTTTVLPCQHLLILHSKAETLLPSTTLPIENGILL